MKEAMFYKSGAGGIQCELCPHACFIKPDKTGICKTRTNYNGKLFATTYGKPCSIQVDPIEKKPFAHFLPASKTFSIATAGCNLSCQNCQNSSISQVKPEDLKSYNLMPSEVVTEAIKHKCKSIAYTYTEPVAYYEYAFDTSVIAHENGLKNLYISNGYINKEPLKYIAKYLDAANIDLKCFDNTIYKKITGGSLQPVLDTLLILKNENVWIEITNLIIPEISDDLSLIKNMCDWLFKNGLHGYPLHFSKFVPQYNLEHLDATPLLVLEKAKQIAEDSGIKYVYLGNISPHEAENTYCPNCRKTLVVRRGYQVSQIDIENGKCKYCNEKIGGVWY